MGPAKLAKAEKLGITILSENDFFELIKWCQKQKMSAVIKTDKYLSCH
jgi:BRCT domain type II-containing protein